MSGGHKFVMDDFGLRAFNNKEYVGTQVHYDPSDFEKKVNEYFESGEVPLVEGSITIGGIECLGDGGGVRRKLLRARLGVIPQDSWLFSGTLRSNLDVDGTRSDAELLDALELAHLREMVLGLDGGLDAPVAEKGDNFSAGQVTRLRRDCAEIAPRLRRDAPRRRRDGAEALRVSLTGAAHLPRACAAQAHTARADGRSDGIC